jgi:hypothetical protein
VLLYYFFLQAIYDQGKLTKSEKSYLARVPDPGVEDPVGLLRPEVGLVIEAACEHLLAEGHDVGRVLQVKPLVAPHPARDPNCQQLFYYFSKLINNGKHL